MKKLISGMVIGIFISLLAFNFTSYAETSSSVIRLIVNGVTLQDTLQPISFQNHVYVPAKTLSEALGANVTWDQTNNAIVVNSLDKTINNPTTSTTPNVTSNTNSSTVKTNNSINNNQTNLAKTEKKEYLLLMKEAGDIGVEGLDILMQNNPTDSEILAMRDKVKTMKDKFNSWGVANQEYKESKTIYINLLDNLDSALSTKGFIQLGGTIAYKASTELEDYIDKIHEDLNKLKAEAIKLKKLNLI